MKEIYPKCQQLTKAILILEFWSNKVSAELALEVCLRCEGLLGSLLQVFLFFCTFFSLLTSL